MSLKTWKEEYYPLPAEELYHGTLEEMLAHSLLKWEGLQRENLAKHELFVEPEKFYLRSRGSSRRTEFRVDSGNCALCQGCTCRSLQDAGEGIKSPGEPPPPPRYLCPLEAVRGCPCDVPDVDEYRSPYHALIMTGDAAPMLALLQQAAKWLEENTDAEEILAI